MKPRFTSRFAIVLTILIFFLASDVIAELSTDPTGPNTFNTILMHIVDGPDPIGALGWQQVRAIPTAQILNTSGVGRGDERPDFTWQAVNGWPVATWAYCAGTDYDIAFSEWDGSSWTPAEFLTFSTNNELDPRIFLETNGTTHVTWWVAGPTDQVFLATRTTGSSQWSTPVQVTPASTGGRRPSVAVFDGVLLVAYERECDEPESAQEIVVARQQAGGGFLDEIVAQTVRDLRLDVILHAENGRLWVDWKHDASTFGYAERGTTAWNAPGNEPWAESTWIGVEDIRRTIRRNLLNQ